MTMMTSLQRQCLALLTLSLAACAPAPIYKNAANVLSMQPAQVAQSTQTYANSEVIWGGSVISVQNFPDHSEIEILAYPLDSSQRPKINAPAAGRFIAIFSGYVEPFNYPSGKPITLRGQLNGYREGSVDKTTYRYPLVNVAQSHVWTDAQMRQGHPNVSFGVGVGVGI